jgi:phosphatidylglycerophosphate synthase
MRISLAEVRSKGQDHPHLQADPTYARWVMRKLSPIMTFAVVRWTPLSADAVTGLAVASGLGAAGLALVWSPAAFLGAALLLQLAYLWDTVDGEVARVRGTSGKRGSYLDLIGHVVQNQALYASGAAALILVTDSAGWALAISLIGLGLAAPFGEQARAQVLGTSVGRLGVHGSSEPSQPRPSWSRLGALGYWAYRRLAFLWAYPASMNLFCIALLADAAQMFADPGGGPLVLPAYTAVFLLTLAVKQVANAIRILLHERWPVVT